MFERRKNNKHYKQRCSAHEFRVQAIKVTRSVACGTGEALDPPTS